MVVVLLLLLLSYCCVTLLLDNRAIISQVLIGQSTQFKSPSAKNDISYPVISNITNLINYWKSAVVRGLLVLQLAVVQAPSIELLVVQSFLPDRISKIQHFACPCRRFVGNLPTCFFRNKESTYFSCFAATAHCFSPTIIITVYVFIIYVSFLDCWARFSHWIAYKLAIIFIGG